MSCDVSEVSERLENELCSAHSPTFPLLHLHHNSFFNPSFASPTSQFILQLFFRFSYVTGSSLTSPGVSSMSRVQIPVLTNLTGILRGFPQSSRQMLFRIFMTTIQLKLERFVICNINLLRLYTECKKNSVYKL